MSPSAPKGRCFVVPAAGRGSRLGIDVPKILAPVGSKRTVWSLLRQRMGSLADHIHVVVSPEGKKPFEAAAANDIDSGAVSVSVQREPRGMGDAIFGARDHWQRYANLFVLWGDQLGISFHTLDAVVDAQSAVKRPTLTLPVTWAERPYVQYVFDTGVRLERILQSREGDRCEPSGYSDVGLFGLSTMGLAEAWTEFESRAALGKSTGEKNFLPFLSFLSVERDWPVQRLTVEDPGEARGLNTPEDLAFFAAQLSAKETTP
jgi:bifunctional UDP-N-acetylglucosamine pyrophosphorylase/glucosamine-1-phosphate N-acetyltransferase